MKKLLVTLFLALLESISLNAQNSDSGRFMLDNIMRSNGRIFVVIAVMLLILFGLVLYVLRIENKITKMENKILKN